MLELFLQPGPEAEQKLQAMLDTCTPTVIHLADGRYTFRNGIRITGAHIRLKGGENVRIAGSRTLHHWEHVTGTPMADRFDPEVREQILMCDLTREGIDEIGHMVSRGFNRPVTAAQSELFEDGLPMKLAQFPKGDAFLTIAAVDHPEKDIWGNELGALEDGFYYHSHRPEHWAPSDSLWALGYWGADWANSMERIDALDPARGFLHTAPPHGNIGFRPGNRFRFYNIPEEITTPGDYCIDEKEKKIYVYPCREQSEIQISLTAAPLFYLDGCRDVHLEDLTLETTRGTAIAAENAEDCTVNRCCLRNLGNYGVTVLDCTRFSVLNSTIYRCGDGGILDMGGNRCTLTPANDCFCNNHIYNVAVWSKCYQPPIQMVGVGMTARHNLIHDCPHTAIMYWGNDMTIEDNEIYSVVMESGDAGAIYTGRDYTFRGNSVSHNFIHHLGGAGMGTMGIYNDDGVSGTKMNHNFLMDLSRGLFLGGGRSFEAQNNVFVRCSPAIELDSRCSDITAPWVHCVNVTMRQRFYEIGHYPNFNLAPARFMERQQEVKGEAVSAMESIYIRRYPELAEIHRYYSTQQPGKVRIPMEAAIEFNVFCSRRRYRYTYYPRTGKPARMTCCGKEIPFDDRLKAYICDEGLDLDRTFSGGMGKLTTQGNFIASSGDFLDPDWGILTVNPQSEALAYGHIPADFDSIGLQPALRRENPPKVLTCIRWTPGQKDLQIGLRNTESIPVSGSLQLFLSPEAESRTREISFSLQAGEERFCSVPVSGFTEDSEAEVRSDQPGIRPARI